ncbi:hypothetical protein P3L10_015596 [Capsicum annuum]
MIKTSITIGSHIQSLIYEGKRILYKFCGVLGHTSLNCNLKSSPFPGPRDPSPLPASSVNGKFDWQTVSFLRKQRLCRNLVSPETSNTWDNCGKLSMTASGAS